MIRAITPRTGVLFLANPNNPTGTRTSREDILRLLREVPKDVLIVMDEAYIEFLDDPLLLFATAWWWLPIGIATAGLTVIARDERLRDLALLCALTIGVVIITGLWSSAPRMALAALPALVAGWSLIPRRPRRLLMAMTTSGGAAAGGIAAADLIDP
jgi:hypothetical protein